jgi:hypothetical protein
MPPDFWYSLGGLTGYLNSQLTNEHRLGAWRDLHIGSRGVHGEKPAVDLGTITMVYGLHVYYGIPTRRNPGGLGSGVLDKTQRRKNKLPCNEHETNAFMTSLP